MRRRPTDGLDADFVAFVQRRARHHLRTAQRAGRVPGAPRGVRWIADRQGYPEGISQLAEFGVRALQDPQQALDWVRSAGEVHEQGRAAGDGWTGRRYAFKLIDRFWQVTGTVDVDTDGRVRRLELTSRATDTGHGLVWSILGWNVHIYHSHIDVHPPVSGDRPLRFEWHQDGARPNRELETDPRPRLSIKAAWWLSDVSRPGRGNFRLVPGSHTANWIDGPPRRDLPWPDPPGAIQVTARPGDVVVFDRRIWHAHSDNHSTITRKAVFFGYTYRWVCIRDKTPTRGAGFTPVQRQLLGMLDDTDGDHTWGHEPARVPLYQLLRQAGQLDPSVPALRA